MSRILIADNNTAVSSFLRKQIKTAYNTVEISETSEETEEEDSEKSDW